MSKKRKTKELHDFMLINPIDESLLETLNADSSTPRAEVIDLIKEYIGRRSRKCGLCGKTHNRRELQIDRRKPLSHGGKDNIKNLQLLCQKCKEIKGDNTMLQTRKNLREEEKT